MEAGNRGVPDVWGEKKMREDLAAVQLDRCQRKKKKIYKVRNGFQKIESTKGKVKRGRSREKKHCRE